MTENRCRWDRDNEHYTTPAGDQCDTPRREHCQAKRSCGKHLQWGEQTCATCLGRTRRDIRELTQLAALMLPEALVTGINSEAAVLAGPACDAEAWSWRKVASKQGRAWHLSEEEDDDDWHPFTILTRWAWMLSAAYDGPTPDVWTIENAAAYLDTILHRVAHDEDQDWRELAGEVKKCRSHLEAVLRNSTTPERGAPCPQCKQAGKFARLELEHGHWCTSDTCTQQFHFTDDTGDVWRCPVNREHWWNPQGYADMLKERMGA